MTEPLRVAEAKPLRVAGSEAQMIQVARALVGADTQRYLSNLRRRQKLPVGQRIGPTAMTLLQQTLARGMTQQLLRRGGWQMRRTLAVGPGGIPRVVRGRLWERHAVLPPLRFGRASFALLAWLVREDVVRPGEELVRQPDATLADDLLHYFAMEHLLRVNGRPHEHSAFRLAPIVQLGFPDALGREQPLPPVEFDELAGPQAFAFEALQPELARRWSEMERAKGGIDSIPAMIRFGGAQQSVLDRLFAALERASPARRDLASFLVEAGEAVLRRGPDHRWWITKLDLRAPLAERQRGFSAAAAVLHGLARLGRWVADAGLVPHFDDEYEAAQLLLGIWQPLRQRPTPGRPSGFELAGMLARELESLHSLGATDATLHHP